MKQQTDVSVSGKVPGYQPHFFRIVDVQLEHFLTWISDLKPCAKKPNNVNSHSFGSQEKISLLSRPSLAELVIENEFALSLLTSVLDLQITFTLSSFKIWQDSQHYLLL